MIKYCKSCGKEYSGECCPHCGYGKKDLKIKALDKYKVEKPERFMTDEEKAQRNERLAAKREAEKKAMKASGAKSRQAQRKKSQWGFIILAAAVFLALLLFLLYQAGYIFQGTDKTEVIKTYFSAIDDGDFESYLSTMVEPMAEDYRTQAKKLGISDADAMDELYYDYTESFGKGYTIKVECGNEEAVSSDEIKNSEDTLEEAYGKSFDIKEAYKVAVTVTFKGSKAEETQGMYVYVGKIKGKWYILNVDN